MKSALFFTTIVQPTRPKISLYQLSLSELAVAKDYVVSLLRNGKIRISDSPFGAILFFVKHNNRSRAVVDKLTLKIITKKNKSPLPRSEGMLTGWGNRVSFPSWISRQGSTNLIILLQEDVKKTAFNTKYGQFEYMAFPMGLFNSPATFQSLMNRDFHDCIDVFMFVYMEDLLLFRETKEEHFKHLQIVLYRLRSE